MLALVALAAGVVLQPNWRDVILNAQESSVLATPGENPTPTPSRRVVNEIAHPGSGDAIAGLVSIIGTPLIQNFARYDVHISPAGMDAWSWLATEYDVLRDDEIHLLDTAGYPDGRYDVRVRAVSNVGNYDEVFLRDLEIRNAVPPTATSIINAAGTRIFLLATLTPTPAPTATPVNEARSGSQQGFFAPLSGDLLQGYAPIVASVFGYPKTPFDRYELAISPSGMEEWSFLSEGEEQYWQETIYLLNTHPLPDGAYDLRLRNIYTDSNYDEYFVRTVRVANQDALRITRPESSQVNGFIGPSTGQITGGVVTFAGTAISPDFLRWELYWSPAGAEDWAYLATGEEEVLRGTLAQLDLTQLPPGGYDFKLRVVGRDYNYDEFFLRNLQIVPPTATPVLLATLTPAPTP
jgi:hypothetical protein